MQLQTIQNKIHEIRGQQVMLDFDLAELYQVETRVLKQSVKRNIDIFPEDFMFQCTKNEWLEVITNCDNLPETMKFSPATPFAFTEHGVTMLANVLKSKKARQTSVAIVRVFIALKKFALSYKELAEKIAILELKYNKHFTDIYKALDFLIKKENQDMAQKERKRIGYK